MTTTVADPIAADPTEVQPPPLLAAAGLARTFRMGDAQLNVLRRVDFDLRPGEFVAIEGAERVGQEHAAARAGGAGLGRRGDADVRRPAVRPADAGAAEPGPHVRPGRPGRAGATSVRVRALLYTAMVVVGIVLVTLGWQLVQHQLDPIKVPPPTATQAREVWTAVGLLAAVVLLLGLRWGADVAAFVWRMAGERPAARLRNKQFGFVFQSYHLLPELNVTENVMLAPEIEYSTLAFRGHRAEVKKRAEELLARLGMGHRLTHRTSQLSGGERQRVAIARALMNRPAVLFADEPTGNLDDETGRQIMDVIEGLHREHGQTIVMVTHDRTLAREADRVLVLRDGVLSAAE